jgi:hypothetical protein
MRREERDYEDGEGLLLAFGFPAKVAGPGRAVIHENIDVRIMDNIGVVIGSELNRSPVVKFHGWIFGCLWYPKLRGCGCEIRDFDKCL